MNMHTEERVPYAPRDVERPAAVEIGALSVDAAPAVEEARDCAPVEHSAEIDAPVPTARQAREQRARQALAGQFTLEEIHFLLDVTAGDFRRLETGCKVASALADNYGWECADDVPARWHPFMHKLCALSNSQAVTLVGVLKQVWRVEMRKPGATDLRSCIEATGLSLSA